MNYIEFNNDTLVLADKIAAVLIDPKNRKKLTLRLLSDDAISIGYSDEEDCLKDYNYIKKELKTM